MCDCEFTPDPDDMEDGEKSWYYLRCCSSCRETWFGLHCRHDGVQNPCPHCGVRPEPEPDPEVDPAVWALRKPADDIKWWYYK
jgi:hypothetical protein